MIDRKVQVVAIANQRVRELIVEPGSAALRSSSLGPSDFQGNGVSGGATNSSKSSASARPTPTTVLR
ncbi:MAG: hypothetical protein QM775_08565 [Pirellulales bacterium]